MYLHVGLKRRIKIRSWVTYHCQCSPVSMGMCDQFLVQTQDMAESALWLKEMHLDGNHWFARVPSIWCYDVSFGGLLKLVWGGITTVASVLAYTQTVNHVWFALRQSISELHFSVKHISLKLSSRTKRSDVMNAAKQFHLLQTFVADNVCPQELFRFLPPHTHCVWPLLWPHVKHVWIASL